ncbi:MAG TPA: MazG nucleotide pyrophosphohydrolase domain-containing protein [Ktedonobacterales bacterium]|jgi:NTP pyrophosphatase (non-canonical NTP hydrolase)|nr:MazG nucleotide pyrophosphohydrolase domain-containing protein [Ktedonobacterales bacterium]
MTEQRDQRASASTPITGAAPGERAASLTLGEAQRAVDASILALGGYWPPLANLARLFEECGELARAVNQADGPKQVKAREAQSETREELGDTLYTLLALANSLGLDAEDALRAALDKTARRVQAPSPTTAEAPQPSASAPYETDL